MTRPRLFLAALLLAAASGAAWFFWLAPTPLEKARKALEHGDPAAAVEILSKRLEEGVAPAAEDIALRQELARAHLMKGSYDGAEASLRSLLKAYPDDPYGHLALGFLFFSRGQDAFAVESFQKARSLAPQDLRASRALLALFNFRGDHDKAREEALDLLDRAPGDPEGRLGLGRAELGRGLFAEAALAFESRLAGSPDNAEVRRLLVEALLGAGGGVRVQEALAPLLARSPEDASTLALQAEYFRLRARDDEAEALLRRIYDNNPGRLFAGIALARSFARRRRTEEAQALLLDISNRLPKSDEIPPPSYASFYEPWETLETRSAVRGLRVDFHLAMAEVYRARYLVTDAQRQTRLALQLAPRDVDALRMLTDVERAGGDTAERVAAARRAADFFPDHPQVLLDLAESLLAAKRPKDALIYAQGAAAVCPALARGQAVLAEAHLALGAKGPAADEANEAVTLNDRDPGALAAQGLVQAASGGWKKADESFERALACDPFLARVHWERARVLEKLQKKREARLHRERALELEPRVYAGR